VVPGALQDCSLRVFMLTCPVAQSSPTAMKLPLLIGLRKDIDANASLPSCGSCRVHMPVSMLGKGHCMRLLPWLS